MSRDQATTFSVEDRVQRRAILGLSFADLYSWVAFFAVLDVLLTTTILNMGGSELNPIAEFWIHRAGVMGMLLLKFGCLLLVLLTIELLSIRRFRLARALAIFWLATWAFPPAFAIVELWTTN